MIERQNASETALATVFLRALSCYEPDEKIRGRDDLAVLFLPDERRTKLPSPAYRLAAKTKIKLGTYAYIIARTSYFDGLFTRALAEQIPQIVLLGAGYDSRAYRFGPQLGGTVVFEVDAAATQRRKIDVLDENRIDRRAVRFVSVDFEWDDLRDALTQNGFDLRKTSLFLWEGVTLYLTPDAVAGTLDAIRDLSRPGSILAFDYLNFEPDNIPKKDEIIQFGLTADHLADFARGHGFAVIENLTPPEIEARFLTDSGGSLFLKTNGTMNLASLRRN